MFLPRVSLVALLVCAASAFAVDAGAQGRGRAGGPAPAPGARAMAPRDFTGYWVSVVTEHWHLRMMMPPKGDYSMLPLTPEARKMADAYDREKDRGSNECRSYGAGAIMRVPGRFYIHWTDDNTLQIDTDSGTQTRVLRFGAPAPPAGQEPQWQGYSVATWEGVQRGRGAKPTGQLRVTTTRMRPGLLRKNGVPYSENARLEEWMETFTEPNGDTWLVDTMILTDPQYLAQPYAVTYGFKKIPDKSGWDPTPCRVDEVR